MFQQIMDEPGISQVALDAAESRKEHGVMSHHQAQDTDNQDKDCVSQGARSDDEGDLSLFHRHSLMNRARSNLPSRLAAAPVVLELARHGQEERILSASRRPRRLTAIIKRDRRVNYCLKIPSLVKR